MVKNYAEPSVLEGIGKGRGDLCSNIPLTMEISFGLQEILYVLLSGCKKVFDDKTNPALGETSSTTYILSGILIFWLAMYCENRGKHSPCGLTVGRFGKCCI